MKLSARASSLYVQAVLKDCHVIGRFSYCFQHGEGIVNPTCCLCYAALNLIPLFITVILLFIIYCSNLRYFTYNSSKYRLHLYLLMFCKSVPMQYPCSVCQFIHPLRKCFLNVFIAGMVVLACPICCRNFNVDSASSFKLGFRLCLEISRA